MVGIAIFMLWQGVSPWLISGTTATTPTGWPWTVGLADFGVSGLAEASSRPSPLDGRIGILEDDLAGPGGRDLNPIGLRANSDALIGRDAAPIRIAEAAPSPGGSIRPTATSSPMASPEPSVPGDVGGEVSTSTSTETEEAVGPDRVESRVAESPPDRQLSDGSEGDGAGAEDDPLPPLPPPSPNFGARDGQNLDQAGPVPLALDGIESRASEQGGVIPEGAIQIPPIPKPAPQLPRPVVNPPQVYGPSRELLSWADRMVERSDLFYRVFAPTAGVVPQGGAFLAEAANLRQAAINFRSEVAGGSDPNRLRASFQNVDAWWSCLVIRTRQVARGRSGPKIQLVEEMGYVRDQVRAWLP